MYLDPWMIVTICLAFGACAWISRSQGFMKGATVTLQALEEQRFIKIDDEGQIKRWTPYGEKQPVKVSRKRK